MFPMLPGLFIKGDNGWVVLAHKTISVPLTNVREILDFTGEVLKMKFMTLPLAIYYSRLMLLCILTERNKNLKVLCSA